MPSRQDVERLLAEAFRERVASGSPPLLERSPTRLDPFARMPMRREAIFAELEAVRTRWRALESDIVRYSERYVNASWTLGDLVAHLAIWSREFRAAVENVARGDGFDAAIPFALTVQGPNAWNQEQLQARRGEPLEAHIEEMDRETARLQELLLELPDAVLYRPAGFPFAPSGDPNERFQAPPAVVILGKCQHDRHHLGQIEDRIRRFREKS